MKQQFLSSVAILALGSAVCLGGSLSAQAADWTGFYLGGYAGGAFGRSKSNTGVACNSPNTPPAYVCDSLGNDAANATAINAGGTGSINADAFNGGMQAGYNWQMRNMVYGLEADFGSFRLSGSRQGSGFYPSSTLGTISTANSYAVGSSFDTDWLMTFRGRFGWILQNNVLAYATGGLALTRLKVGNSFSDNNIAFGAPAGAIESSSSSAVRAGLAVGGGLEWKVDNHWSVKGEYLYLNFGKVTTSGTITNVAQDPGYAQGISTSSDLTANVARIGVNYKY
jgi:outer membrane immunogenic protein